MDWKSTRMQYTANDPRRLCKHIINKLDINNLPDSIKRFKEDIEFCQDRGWGFKTDFEKVVELGNLTLLDTHEWIDVYDEYGIRYAVKKEDFIDVFYWEHKRKPENYDVVEKYLAEKEKKLPLPLEEEEYPLIIEFIKQVLPQKKDFHITIVMSQYIPIPEGIIYEIYESKLTAEQTYVLREDLLDRYDEEESFFRLGEATNTPISEEQDYWYGAPLTVMNNEIIVRMDNGKQYTLNRDYDRVKQLKQIRESKEKLEKEESEKIEKERERQLKIKQDKQRNVAKEKGYLLSIDYVGDLYKQEDLTNFVKTLSWDQYPWEEYYKNKDALFDRYDSVQNLLKNKSLDITTGKFNKVLKTLNYITKSASLNMNNWILKGDGLAYGINKIKDSKYMHAKIPDWYVVHIYNSHECDFCKLTIRNNIKMTDVLFLKDKFDQLYQIVQEYIKNEG